MSTSLIEKFKAHKNDFGNVRKAYMEAEMTFDLYYSGSTVTVIFEDGTKRRQGNFIPKPGMFLANLTNQVVKKRIESGEFVAKNTNPARIINNTIMYSSQNIKKNLRKPCIAVDINCCYWRSAYNLGVIDEKTYQKGMSKGQEYKEARVIAIGSIGALIMHEKYVKGQLISSDNQRRIGACARLDIIDSVWEIAQRIKAKLGNKFLMFLTDCFYVPASSEKQICELIEKEGYEWKKEECMFFNVERMRTSLDKEGSELFTEQVTWFSVDKRRYKHHDFSNIHNIK